MEVDDDSGDSVRKAAKRRLALRLAQKTLKNYRRVRVRLSSSSNVSGTTSPEPQKVEGENNTESRDADALEEYEDAPPEAPGAFSGNAVKGQTWGADWPDDDPEKSQSNKRLAIDEDVQEELACMSNTDTDVRYYERPSKDVVEAREVRDQVLKSKPQVDEGRATDVIPLLSKPAKSAEEKLLVLDARDKLIRIRKNQKNEEGKKLKKKQSGNVGTCPDMCPEKERYERIARHQVDYYECNRETKEVNMASMVKKYARSSADQQMPLQHDLRPGKVLWMTMSYLVNQFMELVDVPGENLGEWYHFLWDRTRSVRKDIVQLELCDQESVLIMEMCARFHIFCMERMREEKMAVFDEKINRENLTKCLQSLQYMYSDLRLNKNECCPNEPEFQAYSILLHINSDLCTSTILSLSQEMLQNEKVKFAVQVYLAVSSRNFVGFFKLVKSTTYLNACILHQYFAQVRAHAIRAIIRAFSRQKMRNIYPLYELQKQLLFDSEDDAREFCRFSNVPVVEDSVILDKKVLKPIPMQEKMKRSYVGVECKRTSSVREIVAGGSVPVDISVYHRVHNSFNADDVLKNESWYAEDQRGFIENEEQMRKLDDKARAFTFSSVSLPASDAAVMSQSGKTLLPVSTSSFTGQEAIKGTQVFTNVPAKAGITGDTSNFFKTAIVQNKPVSENDGQSVFHQPPLLSDGSRNIPSIFGGSSLRPDPSQLPSAVPVSQGTLSSLTRLEKTAQQSSAENSRAAFTFSTPLVFGTTASQKPSKPVSNAAIPSSFSFTVPAVPVPATTNSTFKSPTNSFFDGGAPKTAGQVWTPTTKSSSQAGEASAGTFVSPNEPLAKPGSSFQFVVDQKPPVFDQKPSVFDQKPSVFDQKPSVFGQKPSVVDQKPSVFDQKPSVFDQRISEFVQKPSVFGTFPSQPLLKQTHGPVSTSGSQDYTSASSSENKVCTMSSTVVFTSHCRDTTAATAAVTAAAGFSFSKPVSFFPTNFVTTSGDPSVPSTSFCFSTPKSMVNSVTTPSVSSVSHTFFPSTASDVPPSVEKDVSSSEVLETSPKKLTLSESESEESSSSSSPEEMESEDDVSEGSVVSQEEISQKSESPELLVVSPKKSSPLHSPEGPTAVEMEVTRQYKQMLLARAFYQWRTFMNRAKLKRRIELHNSTLPGRYEHRLSMPPGCQIVDHRTLLDYTINAEEIGSGAFRSGREMRRIKLERLVIESLSTKLYIDSNIFWKLGISLPSEVEAGMKYSLSILQWADKLFSDEEEGRRFKKESDILRMSCGRISGADFIVTSVQRVVGLIRESSDLKGVNGVLFFTSPWLRDVDACHNRFQEMLRISAAHNPLPVVVIVGGTDWKPVCREWLLRAMERKKIVEYRMIGPLDLWEEATMRKIEGSIRWLAGFSKPDPPIAGYPLKDIVLHINEDLWIKVRFSLAARCSSGSRQHPQDLLDLYNETLTRLQKMLRNYCIHEFVDIAPEFEDVLHHKEFSEQNHMCKMLMPHWKEEGYIKKLYEAFQKMSISVRLPPDEDLTHESFCEAFRISYPELRRVINEYQCKWKMHGTNIDWVFLTKVLVELRISYIMENNNFQNLVGVFFKSDLFKFYTEPWYRSLLKDRWIVPESQKSPEAMEMSASAENSRDDVREVTELSELSEDSKVPDLEESTEDTIAKFEAMLDEFGCFAEVPNEIKYMDLDEIEKKLNEYEAFLMKR